MCVTSDSVVYFKCTEVQLLQAAARPGPRGGVTS